MIFYGKARAADAPQIAQIVLDAFSVHFRGFFVPKATILKALTKAVDTDKFYVAREGEKVLGIVAIGDEGGYPLRVQPETLKKTFGPLRGGLAKIILGDEFRRPRKFQKGEGHVDWVAVRPECRGRGIAKGLLEEALKLSPLSYHTLDVVEGNEEVIPLYQNSGFREIGREKENFGLLKGFRYRHQMRRG